MFTSFAENRHLRPFLLGFHGCDEAVGEAILSGRLSHLEPSTNPYDWLGDGIYFFENDPDRAMHFAVTSQQNPHKKYTSKPIHKPFVLGAIIDPGACLDLTHQQGIKQLKWAVDVMKFIFGQQNRALPRNKPADAGDKVILIRNLDRAAVNYLHTLREKHGMPPVDTVRSSFLQGDCIAETSAFREYSHTQIAVRNANSIIGYFRPQFVIVDPFEGAA
ncbi:hypothetical protein [Collimonas sp.]|jgi:hypothetical protein|uniref:hypothetical protein n=1 Tax=Collimonas sp. TaxID=1963772 RepID=UPI002BC6B028|nr:hypothetical protein [Collimonas sp.]HWW05814.1 hypothetical protein [Collimonas sp.]